MRHASPSDVAIDTLGAVLAQVIVWWWAVIVWWYATRKWPFAASDKKRTRRKESFF